MAVTGGTIKNYFDYGSGAPSTDPDIVSGEWAFYQDQDSGEVYKWNLDTAAWELLTTGGGGGGGTELAYAEITAPDTKSGSTASDISGLTSGSVVIPSGATVEVGVYFPLVGLDSGTNSRINFRIIEDSTQVAGGFAAFTNTVTLMPVNLRARLQPSAGSHTYKVQWSIDDGSGTGTFYAGSATPAWIQVKTI